MFGFHTNLYTFIFEKNLLEFFFINNNYYYSFNNFIFINYLFLTSPSPVLFFNTSFFFDYSFLFSKEVHLSSTFFEDSCAFDNLYTKGYFFNLQHSYIVNDYLLNTSGKLRFNFEERALNNFLFFNKHTNLWLNYCFFFFENYDTMHIRLKKKTSSVIFSSDLRLNWYKTLLKKYYNISDLQDGVASFINYTFFKANFTIVPFRDVQFKLFNFYKNFIMDLKLFLIYETVPNKIGLNFLIKNNYLVNLDSRFEKGLKFSLFNSYLYENCLIESNSKYYGSHYVISLYKFFNNFDIYRTENFFSNLHNINQFLYLGNRYTYASFSDISYLGYFFEDSLSWKLDYLSDTLFFERLQNSIIFNINNSYFNILKFYSLKA